MSDTSPPVSDERYPVEKLDPDSDDGTMPANVKTVTEHVVGRRIVSVETDVRVCLTEDCQHYHGWNGNNGTVITLDNGKRVGLINTNDCCASTELEAFLLNPDLIDHIITGVGTTDGYTKWHVYADMGDVLELTVGWSPGNPFYYGYGFDIYVTEVPA